MVFSTSLSMVPMAVEHNARPASGSNVSTICACTVEIYIIGAAVPLLAS